jgi:endonuclease VIII-like 1
MPEGPELRLMAKYINESTAGEVFTKIEKSKESKNVFENLEGEFTIEAESRGKELRVRIKSEDKIKDLYMTMGMSGNWFFSTVENMKKHSHLRFYTADGDVLCFVDARRFGKWKFAQSWNSDRGPDMINDFEAFYDNLRDNLSNKAFDKPICEVLMNQKYFNGIGNYLRAEILDRADIDPFKPAREVALEGKLLGMCTQVQLESFKIGGGEFKTFVNPNSNADEKGDAFVEWLQCYEKKKKIKDGTGRSFWYDEKWDKRCYYCNGYMPVAETYTEDRDEVHEKCLADQQKYWENREEYMDLMGF